MNDPINRGLTANKWTLQYPELGTGPLPHEPNISAAYFEKEREKLFKRTWLLLCRDDELPRPGSYVVKQVAILETSVLLVRGEDNVIRAFHNSCRHRGNKVVMGSGQKSGDGKGFICGFHGWTYDLQGKLKNIVDEEDFFDIDKSQLGLKPIHCGVWRGFIFINVMDNPKQTLEEALGQWGRDVADFPFENFEQVVMYSANIRCNWKIALDAFQENYHVQGMHGRSAAAALNNPKTNPFGHLVDVRLYPEGHRQAGLPANTSFVPKPAVQMAVKYAGGTNVYAYSDAGQRKASGVNRTNSPEWSFDLNVVFPHVQLIISDGFILLQHYWPVAVDETYWELRQYLPKSKSVAGRIAQQNSLAALRDVIREDLVTLENTQSVLRSGAITHMQLCDSEITVRHSYYMVDKIANAAD